MHFPSIHLLLKMKKIYLLFFFQLIFLHAFSQDGDSLFIQQVKEYVFRQIGVRLTGDFYTDWSKEEKPFLYVYVSLPDKIECPTEQTNPYIYCGTDTIRASDTEKHFREQGYHFFCYKTFANSATLLNKRLMLYRNETKSFIVFHELVHNYLQQQKIKIPYEFNEALSDVIGNYGTLKYSIDSGKTNREIAKQQLKTNEKLYSCMNRCIAKINSHPGKTHELNERCQRKIQRTLKKSDAFQKDRFDYEVNNAYLLKNEYYCKNYFLLKKVFLKQGTIKDFLEIIRKMPEKKLDCEKFLEKYT